MTAPASASRSRGHLEERLPRAVRVLLFAVVVGLLGAVNLYLAGKSISLVLGSAPAVDWDQYVEASRRVNGGDLYAVTDTYAYHYSPLLAFLFGPLSWLGTVGWRVLHVGAALAMPTWPMRGLALVSWPLWYDVEAGNILVFVVLAAAWALRGSRLVTGAYLLLVLLVPRPLMLPLAIWLLWKRPEWRVPFAAAFVIHLVAVLATGWGDDWLHALIAAGGDVTIPSNIGPSRFVGTLPWLVIGLPLAAWLTWKGRLGLAGLAASPYWLPYYLLMLLLELPRRDRTTTPAPARAPAT
jgi:hypothetical protein